MYALAQFNVVVPRVFAESFIGNAVAAKSSDANQITRTRKLPDDSSFDAVTIGAGHNALTTASCLSRSGLKKLVLERPNIVGGCELESGCLRRRGTAISVETNPGRLALRVAQ